MPGRIVVGIDGSPQSADALEWAVARAALGGQSLELVNAYSAPVDVDFYGFHGLAATGPADWLAESSKALLATAAERIRALQPDLDTTLTSEMGAAAFVLGNATQGADAVVVGRRGLGAAASVVLGSVSNRLTVEARCPLVVVGDGDRPTSGPIVVGVDGSEFGTAALRYAVAEAALRKTSVLAVTAYLPLERVAVGDPELLARMGAGLEAEAAGIIDQAVAAIGHTSVPIEQVTAVDRPADAILAHAADAQLIVVGTHGKGLVRRVLLGSVSRRILHDADRPVALVNVPET